MRKKRRFTDIYKNDPTFSSRERIIKARKILAVIADYKGSDLSKASCVDVGCSVGFISEYLARYSLKVVGVDVDEKAIRIARKRVKMRNVSFIVSGENKLPLKNNSFDVAVFNQVYEHTENPEKLTREIKRVLKPGGICYLGARNKFWFFDGHYPLPFLSWLPASWANQYFSLFSKKDSYDINLYSYWELKKMVERVGLKIYDYSLWVIRNPHKFKAKDIVPTFLGINRPLFVIARMLYVIVPNYVWILKKNDS